MSIILWSVSKRVDDPVNTLHDFTILNSQSHKCCPLYLLGTACFQISRCIRFVLNMELMIFIFCFSTTISVIFHHFHLCRSCQRCCGLVLSAMRHYLYFWQRQKHLSHLMLYRLIAWNVIEFFIRFVQGCIEGILSRFRLGYVRWCIYVYNN